MLTEIEMSVDYSEARFFSNIANNIDSRIIQEFNGFSIRYVVDTTYRTMLWEILRMPGWKV